MLRSAGIQGAYLEGGIANWQRSVCLHAGNSAQLWASGLRGSIPRSIVSRVPG
jgi:hypothetical protein